MKNSPVQSHVLRLAHPPIPTVHIGIIGLGNRGLLTLQRYLQIEGVEIKALCEIREGPTTIKRSRPFRSHRIYRSGGMEEDVRIG
jgi:predicted homoserine dehydrogenase-like protein